MSDTSRELQHIGFIMDGNRRWAKKLKNIATFWHKNGWENIEKVLSLCLDEGIQYVSMWALSKENITERDTEEVTAIYQLMEDKIPTLVPKLQKQWIRLEVVWDLWLVPPHIRTILLDAMESTSTGDTMTFILAIGYSWQDEIVRWVKRCIAEGIDPAILTEKEFQNYLDTGKYPPPDIIVRTGGNIRHSGYFLYQSAYSEYFFTETLWPDFGKKDLDEVLSSFKNYTRNFGK